MSLSALDNLLVRIQGKIESRTRRPWFDLQRSYFFKDRYGVKNVAELRTALEHFHVLLSDNEYEVLFNGFNNNNNNVFDFKAFAAKLYPKESGVQIVREGRAVDTLSSSSSSSSSTHTHTHHHHTHSHSPQPQQSQQIYTHYDHEPTIQSQQSAAVYYAPTHTSISPFQQAGNAIMTSDIDVPRLGETLNANGTTSYYQKKNARNVEMTGTVKNGGGQKVRTSDFQPRVTYNRAHHQRYNESEYEDYLSGMPHQQAYPAEEFKSHGVYQTTLGKARFQRKQLPELVEVNRRHNISRQYNTKTGKSTQ